MSERDRILEDAATLSPLGALWKVARRAFGLRQRPTGPVAVIEAPIPRTTVPPASEATAATADLAVRRALAKGRPKAAAPKAKPRRQNTPKRPR